jgi:hypothetical protein
MPSGSSFEVHSRKRKDQTKNAKQIAEIVQSEHIWNFFVRRVSGGNRPQHVKRAMSLKFKSQILFKKAVPFALMTAHHKAQVVEAAECSS